MAINLSVLARNAMLDAIEVTAAANALFHIYTNAVPANCAAVRTGTLLVNTALGVDWMAAAANGVKAINGTWASNGVANGTAGYFSIMMANAAVCVIQGNCTVTGGGGDCTLDSTNISVNQVVNITGFTLTAPNS